jgi:predicted transcriptional regulator
MLSDRPFRFHLALNKLQNSNFHIKLWVLFDIRQFNSDVSLFEAAQAPAEVVTRDGPCIFFDFTVIGFVIQVQKIIMLDFCGVYGVHYPIGALEFLDLAFSPQAL